MKLHYTVTLVALPGTNGFPVAFDLKPHLADLGTVIGWARIEQRKAGRTCFAISAAQEGLLFQPATPVDNNALEKQLGDLIFLLNGIGFRIASTALSEFPKKIRPAIVPTERPLAA